MRSLHSLTDEEAELLAVIKATEIPTINPRALVNAGLPQEIAQALLMVLAKTSGGTDG